MWIDQFVNLYHHQSVIFISSTLTCNNFYHQDKLEFLGGDRACLSKFQVQLIALETRLQDWEAGKYLEKLFKFNLKNLNQITRISKTGQILGPKQTNENQCLI